MTMHRTHKLFEIKRYLIITISVFLTICYISVCCSGNADHNNIISQSKKTIIFDPGHGGQDVGAKGPGGTIEKTLALSIAHILAKKLDDKYNVLLTRTDDYRLDLFNRASKANAAKADLFVSLHAGGNFIHSGEGITIFYAKDTTKTGGSIRENKAFPDKNPQIFWDSIQCKHLATSKLAAKEIHKSLSDRLRHHKIKIAEAPMPVLSGADMPSILIEIGCLSNANEEKKLTSTAYLSELAEGVYQGINTFFTKK